MGSRWRVGLLIGVLAAATLVATPAEAKPECMGREATIVGTNERDVIEGTAEADVIAALKGRDKVLGRGGDDLICMGRGGGYRIDDDQYAVYEDAFGGAGNDKIDGGPGFEIIRGGDGPDVLISGSSPTSGCCGEDHLFGNEGSDVLRGGPSFDLLDGGRGDDALHGGAAFDSLYGRGGNDDYDGGPGEDLLEMFTRGERPQLLIDLERGIARGEGDDVLESIEWVYSKVSTKLIGNEKANTFYLEQGNDNVFGGPGADFISDIKGTNTMNGGRGRDTMAPNANVEEIVVDGGPGSDFLDVGECVIDPPTEIRFDLGYYECYGEHFEIKRLENYEGTYAVEHVTGNGANNFIDGAGRDDEISGKGGDDVLWGGLRNDTIFGGEGNDRIDAGKGTDVVDGGNGEDQCKNGETTVNCP